MKKFELTTETKIKFGRTLHRIRALVNIDSRYIKAGDMGGWLENEGSLSHDGNCWIYDGDCFKESVIMGGVIWGGEIWGGVIWGGVIMGGVIMGGVIMGGEIWGGEIWGGEIWGGVIRGGVIWGGEIKSYTDYIAFLSFGSSGRTLCAYKLKDGGFEVTCGGFRGTLKEFTKAVKQKHGNSKIFKEYLAAARIIKLRFEN